MKQSKVFIPTMRDVSLETKAWSHRLLLKAGLIKQSTSRIYSHLPLVARVLNNIAAIVWQEAERVDSTEISMPASQQTELWEESGRWDAYGSELMRLQDRHGRQFALDPTYEKSVTSIVRSELESYKRLPMMSFQIQSKFRDEKGPRFGLLRGHELIVKDAYSFHADEASLDQTHQNIYRTYSRIFERVGINARPVATNSGITGGSYTHEFMALSATGEDIIVHSKESDYAASIEKAGVAYEPNHKHTIMRPTGKIEAPNVRIAQKLVDFLGRLANEIVKTMVFKVGGEYIMVLVRGHHEINDIKLKPYFGTDSIELATQDETVDLVDVNLGSLGPVIDKEIRIYVDNFVQDLNNLVAEANEDGYYLINVNAGGDFNVDEYGGFRFILEGEKLSDGSGITHFVEGIEAGQVFKLDTKYSESMNATFSDNQGKAQPLVMGYYGIGISRTLSAIVEQNHGDNGTVWPKSVAPFDLRLISINPKKNDQRELADTLHTKFNTKPDVLYNDRQERAGIKPNDADLVGLSLQVVVDKCASEGIVEVKERLTDNSEEVHIDDLMTTITNKHDDLK